MTATPFPSAGLTAFRVASPSQLPLLYQEMHLRLLSGTEPYGHYGCTTAEAYIGLALLLCSGQLALIH